MKRLLARPGRCTYPVRGRERHEWRHAADPDAVLGPAGSFLDEMAHYRQRCTRCGDWKE